MIVLITAPAFSEIVSSETAFLFESRCESMRDWEPLDFGGDGRCVIETDTSVPSGFGPNVLRVRGAELVVLAKNVLLKEGTIVVLWKDDEPLSNDSDGVLLFQGDYSKDLTTEYNLKQNRPHYFVEQDADAGFQIKYHPGDPDKIHLVKARNGIGLTQGEWNRTGWIWQKLRIRDDLLKAKFWSASKPEPSEWHLELPGWEAKEGRIGLQVWSGYASVAYFAASESTVSIQPPVCGLHALRSQYSTSQPPAFLLFFNLEEQIPNAAIALSRGNETKRLTETLPKGYSEIQLGPGPDKPQFPLPSEIQEGEMEFKVAVTSGDEGEIGSVSRVVRFRSDAEQRRRIREIKARTEETIQTAKTEKRKALRAYSALPLIELAQAYLADGDFDSLNRALDYTKQLLIPDSEIVGYTCENIHLSSASLSPGKEYDVSVDWRCLRDSSPTETLLARLTITDDLFAETPVAVQMEIAPSDWKDNRVNTVFKFELPEEYPAGSITPISRPPFREGFHRIWVSLHPVNENGHKWLDLPNPARGDFGTYHQIGRVYISLEPIEITHLEWDRQHRIIRAPIRSDALSPVEIVASLRITTLSGRIIMENTLSTILEPKQAKELSFSVEDLNWFGPLQIALEIYDKNHLMTRAEKPIHIPSPNGYALDITRKNKIESDDDGYWTVLEISADSPDTKPSADPLRVGVYQSGRQIASKEFSLSQEGPCEIRVRPALGTYELIVSTPMEGAKTLRREFRILAPVVETKNGKIYLNGEEFIVKGINCHALIPQSPRRTRQIMKLLKEIGFNMLRGDYPPPWEVDMAVEENLGWMVLAPFSVTTTDVLKERHAPHPFARMCEISERFVRVYRDQAGVWLWNSCNEVTVDIDELLRVFYPIYKHEDPYERPVVYANLFGQERTGAQDIMGVNYYFGPPNTSEDRQPLIEKSIGEAKDAGIPCIYTECNTFYGPVYSLGKAAVEDMYEFGLEKGMSGGFMYQLREDADRHPGVISGDSTLWFNPTFITALRRAFADATVDVDRRGEGKTALRIKNKRPYSLRNCTYQVSCRGSQILDGRLDDIVPFGEESISLNDSRSESSVYEVVLDFETHYGIWNHLRMEVFADSDAVSYK